LTHFVSVIIPVYNDPRVELAVQALLAQDYPASAFEIIVVDNASTDDTPAILRRLQATHPERIRLGLEDEIQSSYAARNKGIEMARGDILAFTDSDCIPTPSWLSAGVAGMIAQGASCAGGAIEFTFQGGRPNVYEYWDAARKLNQRHYVQDVGFAATANFFVYRGILERHGFFRSDLISGGDYEFGRRVTQAGETMIYLPEAIAHHPARATFWAIYRKSRRVARGQQQLERLSLLQHGRRSLRQLRPTRSYPEDPRWVGSLSHLDKLRLVALGNLLRWITYFVKAA